MNTRLLSVMLLAWASLFYLDLKAQTVVAASGSTVFLPAPASQTKKHPIVEDISSVRQEKPIPKLFSGYAIEVAVSRFPLDRTAPVFRQFGSVRRDKLAEGGYSYVVLLPEQFTKASALEYLQNSIGHRVEKARLFLYDEGKRNIVRGE